MLQGIIQPAIGVIPNSVAKQIPEVIKVLDDVQLSEHSLYTIEMEKARRQLGDDEKSGFQNTLMRIGSLSEVPLEVSPFMKAEILNWRFSYLGGIITAIMSSSEYKNALEINGKTKAGKLKSLNQAIQNPRVREMAVFAAHEVCACVNPNPAAAFAPTAYHKNQYLRDTLWWTRFMLNMVQNYLEIYGFKTMNKLFSPELRMLLTYGGDAGQMKAARIQVYNGLAEAFSPKNLKRAYKNVKVLNQGLSFKQAVEIGQKLAEIRDEEIAGVEGYSAGDLILTGKRARMQRLRALMRYHASEYGLNLIFFMLKNLFLFLLGRKIIGEKRARRKVGAQTNPYLMAAIQTHNIGKVWTGIPVAGGLTPQMEFYALKSPRATGDALIKYTTTSLIPHVGAMMTPVEFFTGLNTTDLLHKKEENKKEENKKKKHQKKPKPKDWDKLGSWLQK